MNIFSTGAKFYTWHTLWIFCVSLSSAQNSKPRTFDDEIDLRDKTTLAKCSQKWSTKFAHLKTRFSDQILQQHCQMGAKWAKDAKAASKPKALLSAEQLRWVRGIWDCKDLICLCRKVLVCKRFLEQLELGFTQMKTWGDNLKKNITPVKRKNTPRRSKRDATVQKLLHDAVQGKLGLAARKEIRMMNNEEKSTFLKAIDQLKVSKIGDKTKYEMLVLYHTPEYAPEAHFCAAFFPFHRQLMNSIEVALREVQPAASLPYWDPTLDQPLPDARDSILWTEELLGNGDGDVKTGPFANWTTIPDAQVASPTNSMRIARALGASPYGSLLRDSDIDTIMSKPTFRDLSYCIDPFVEMIHGGTHMWVGGHMLDLRTSPNDPAFFLYHCFLDSVWEAWRQQKQTVAQRQSEYTPDQDSCNTFCYAQADMKPFPMKNIDGLSNDFTSKLYTYAPKPTCTQQNPDCVSPYLFCDTRKYKCISKVKAGGNCTGFEGQSICYKSQCNGGRCQATDQSVTTFAPTFPPEVVTEALVVPQQITQPPVQTIPPTAPPTAPTVGLSTGPMKTVWIPITVINIVGAQTSSYPNALIISTDTAHGVKLTGVVSDPSKVPYYTGAAFTQVLNPFSVQDGVQAVIDVFDENMEKCESLCLLPNTTEYTPCEAKVSLSSNVLNSDNIPYTPDFEDARLINWNGNKRNLDKFIFRCHAASSEPVTEPSIIILTSQQPGQSVVINGVDGGVNVHINTISDNGTASVMNGGCQNMDRCCAIWSGAGECRRNPWMQTNCQKECGVCKSGVDINAQCVDYDPSCARWAAGNQCTINDAWMEENCRKSCSMCNRNMAQLLVLCGVSGGAEKCIDTDEKCQQWADTQECERNPWWMKENCAVSCKSCKK